SSSRVEHSRRISRSTPPSRPPGAGSDGLADAPADGEQLWIREERRGRSWRKGLERHGQRGAGTCAEARLGASTVGQDRHPSVARALEEGVHAGIGVRRVQAEAEAYPPPVSLNARA